MRSVRKTFRNIRKRLTRRKKYKTGTPSNTKKALTMRAKKIRQRTKTPMVKRPTSSQRKTIRRSVKTKCLKSICNLKFDVESNKGRKKLKAFFTNSNGRDCILGSDINLRLCGIGDEVEVKQTEILAYFLENNQKILIGQNGKEIKDKIISTKDLPILIGTININKFLSLNKLLLENEFNLKDFTRIYYFKSDRWDLEFKNNLIIKLPFNGLDETLKKLKKIYNKNQFNNLKIIDLRVAGRIIVK